MKKSPVNFSSLPSGAALALQPFAVMLALASVLRPPTAEQLAAADPLLQLFGAGGLPAIAALAFALGLAALGLARPDRDALRATARAAALGVLAVVVFLPLLRLAIGPGLPSFIPAEENARPGPTAALAAGVLEEAFIHVVLLPALLALGLGRSLQGFAFAALLTGLVFALLHELGPAPFRADYFVVRTLVPGAAMSLACRWPGFGAVVAGHCTAHRSCPRCSCECDLPFPMAPVDALGTMALAETTEEREKSW